DLVLVGVTVEMAPAHGTEARAVVPAEDLLRERQRERVARPGREIETILDDVRRRQLVRAARARGLVFAQRKLPLEDRVLETAIAGPVQTDPEVELEDGAGGGAGHDQLG